MKELFLSLINQAPPGIFANVEVYNSQIDRVRAGKISINYPSLYIEVKNHNPVNLGRNLNRMDLDIRFHIAMVELDAGDGTMDQNLNIFKLRDLVNKAYVSFTPFDCGSISNQVEYQDYKHTNLYHYITQMKCHWTDTSAVRYYYMGSRYLIWDLAEITWDNCNVTWDMAFGPLLNLALNIDD